jgi:hypothetical protein
MISCVGYNSKLGISLDTQLLFRGFEEESYLLQINDYVKFHVILLCSLKIFSQNMQNIVDNFEMRGLFGHGNQKNIFTKRESRQLELLSL